jgi:hypothetical protein
MTISTERERTSDVAGRRSPSVRGERGVHGLVAAFITLVIAGIGGAIDIFTGNGLRTVFAVCLIVGVVIAGIVVRRRDALYIVFAPPLITVLLALINVATTSKGAFDLMASYLAHGFPPIAIASAVGAVIAGIRLLSR